MNGDPIFTKRQLVQSAGQWLTVFLTAISGHVGVTYDLTWPMVASAAIQATLAALVILGVSRVGPNSNGG